MEPCPRCKKVRPTGPWEEDGYDRLCGPCKCYLSLSRPGFATLLARSLEPLGVTHVSLRPGTDPAKE